MDQDTVVNLTTSGLHLALKVAAPLLVAGLVVGLVVSVFQAVTQIQEQTLSFIPKILAIFGILVVLGPWMLNQLVAYATELWTSIPNFIGP
jgi:flagellar biosynthetic protein FliQ